MIQDIPTVFLRKPVTKRPLKLVGSAAGAYFKILEQHGMAQWLQ